MGYLQWMLRVSRLRAWRQLGFQLCKLVVLPLIIGCAIEQWGSLAAALLELNTGSAPWARAVVAGPPEVSFPLRTIGKRIVDNKNQTVRLRCVNWYGAHMQNMVVGGLHKQSLHALVGSIQALGFNCVRLPYSLEMHLDRADARPSVDVVAANPQLLNLTVLQIFDATVHVLAHAGIMIILNNHQGKSMWCCSENDGEGLWFSKEYSEADWLRSWQMLARRYHQQPYVVGYDLRNELRGIPAEIASSLQISPEGSHSWPHWTKVSELGTVNWAAAALRGGLAVLEEDPDGLIIVEGLDFATDLRGVKHEPLHRDPRLTGRVVYEAHDYCWYHNNFLRGWELYWLSLGWLVLGIFELRGKSKVGLPTDEKHENRGAAITPKLAKVLFLLCLTAAMVSQWMTSYAWFRSTLDERWGYILDADEAPVWLGEFGTNGYWTTANWWMEVGEVVWLRHLLRYMKEHDLGYAYWALNGDKDGEDETFGLLHQDYVSLRHPWLMQLLHQ